MATTIEMTEPETAFLKTQKRQAREHLSGSLRALPRSLEHAISPRAWTARFPWIAMGVTVVGVFSLAVAIERRKARSSSAALHAAAHEASKRSAGASCPVRQAGLKTARHVRSGLRKFVLLPLRTAMIAHLRGLF